MKKIKLITSLSSIGVISCITPVIVTSCSYDGYHYWYELENNGNVNPGGQLNANVILYRNSEKEDQNSILRQNINITNSNGNSVYSTTAANDKISEVDFKDDKLTLLVGSAVPTGTYHYRFEGLLGACGVYHRIATLEFDFNVV